MKKEDLQIIADRLRRDSLMMTTAAGSGHPTSCLSCAEIMSVLFFRIMKFDVKNPHNPDNDEFVLSKGHAAPILYAVHHRIGSFKGNILSLRKFGSKFEGHPIPSSFAWAKVATGSLGQGLANGVGMALASRMQQRNFNVYVLMGDSEIAEGSVYEAVAMASHYKLNNLTAIVDVNRLGQTGPTQYGHRLGVYKKRFEAFGAHVVICDGHDVVALQMAFHRQHKNKPLVILAKTYKGKGVYFIEDKNGWHGKALSQDELVKALEKLPDQPFPKFSIKKPIKHSTKLKKNTHLLAPSYDGKIATRQAYGQAIAKLGANNDWIVVVDAETKNSTFSINQEKVRPQHFVQAYIAEQDMAGSAVGLAVKGHEVFASTFAAFLTRAYDQIRMAAISGVHMTFIGSHVGVSIGEDGSSQMGLEDIAMFRNLIGSTVFYPSDGVSCEKLVQEATKQKGIVYIRTSRPKTPVIYDVKEKFPAGDFKVVRSSSRDKVIIVGSGVTLHEAIKASDTLKKLGIHVTVVDCYCIKPFDKKKFEKFVGKKPVIVVEDHYEAGGIGDMIRDIVSIEHLCIREMPHTGPGDLLMKTYGIDATAIVKIVKKTIKTKK